MWRATTALPMKLPPDAAAAVTLRRAHKRLSLRRAAEVSGLAVGTWQRAEGGGGVSYQSLVSITETLGWNPAFAVDELLNGNVPVEVPAPSAAGVLVAGLHDLDEHEQDQVAAFIAGLVAKRSRN